MLIKVLLREKSLIRCEDKLDNPCRQDSLPSDLVDYQHKDKINGYICQEYEKIKCRERVVIPEILGYLQVLSRNEVD